MATRNVVLTAYHDRVINRLVKSGKYQNASEVLREGVRLVAQREAENAARTRTLRAAIQVGLDDLKRGDFREFDSVEDFGRFVDDLAARVTSKPRKSA